MRGGVRGHEALATGKAALAAGRWAQARAAFEDALAVEETPEAWDGLAQALHWLCEYRPAIKARERAFAGFRARGETRYPAVLAAYWLAWEYAVVYGNFAAASGWLARGQRLAEQAGDCIERGWVELANAVVTDDVDTKERHVNLALAAARRFGDTDLEYMALSYAGLCHIMRGKIDDGKRLLDEAVAAVTAGEVGNVAAAGEIYCKMLLGCEMTMDVRRAEQWLEVAESFVAETNFVGVSGICRMHYGGILTAAGRWTEAESELGASIRIYQAGYRGLLSGALARLAELRARQGRLEECAALLAGQEDDSFAVRPLARLCLRRGDPERAVTLLRGYLEATSPTGDPMFAPVLALLAEAELAAGHTHQAQDAAATLAELAHGRATPLVQAFADFTSGLTTPPPDALVHFQHALRGFAAAGLVPEAARTHVELARLLATVNQTAAVNEAQAAHALFEQLGATADADAAASLLRDLGVRTRPPRPHSTGLGALSKRETEVLELLGAGLTNPEIAQRLFISRKTASHHVSAVLTKLGLRNRTEAAAYALRHLRQR